MPADSPEADKPEPTPGRRKRLASTSSASRNRSAPEPSLTAACLRPHGRVIATTRRVPRLWRPARPHSARVPLRVVLGEAERPRTSAGVLQVGDMGYFPDISRMDKASIRHAKDDPLELGAHGRRRPEPTSPTGCLMTTALPAGAVVHRGQPRGLRRTRTLRPGRGRQRGLRGGRLLPRSRDQGRRGSPLRLRAAHGRGVGRGRRRPERPQEPPAARVHPRTRRRPTHDRSRSTCS